MCPRECGINRNNSKGYCGAGIEVMVYTAFLHRGEEPAISGEKGSGTIFFSGCNLKCVYCQNYKFSHFPQGEIITLRQLADIMLRLQEKGAHNINLVTPSHYLAQIMEALLIAFKEGLEIPIVYNTSGYDKESVIYEVNAIIDVYLIDLKYITPALAKMYSCAEDYPVVNQKVIKMIYLCKPAVWEGQLLKEGVLIRHLVLPGYVEETLKVLTWVKKNAPFAILSLMFQYQPYFKASTYPQISRRVNISEYTQIKEFLQNLDLKGWVQDFDTEVG